MDILKSRPEIVTWIKDIAREQGIENCTITDVKTNEKGEGYSSQIFLITVKDTTTDKQLDMVMKVAAKNDKGEYNPYIAKCFLTENHFYSKVYSVFKKFEQSKGIVEDIEFVPKYYNVSEDIVDKVVCLENLKVTNYEVFDKKNALDDEHLSFLFKLYGRFHAYSCALRDQQPNVYKELIVGLPNLFGQYIDDDKVGFSNTLRVYSELAHKYLIPGEDDGIIKKFEKYLGNGIVTIFGNIVKEEIDFVTITHGDCWSNNMMFKYKQTENGKELSDVRLLDLQIASIGSPVRDLSYILYSSGNPKKVFDNLEKYLKIYYESFSSFLKALGSDPEKLFPYSTLKDHWKKYSKFGMCMALILLKLKISAKEDVKDVSDGLEPEDFANTSLNFKFDEKLYQKRLRELLYHLSEIDAL